jgi:predicted nuclease of predicted toxin-antitoxin system
MAVSRVRVELTRDTDMHNLVVVVHVSCCVIILCVNLEVESVNVFQH